MKLLNPLKQRLLLLCLASCLGPKVTGRVYYWNGTEWELSKNRVTLPEGWLAGPLDLPEGEAE